MWQEIPIVGGGAWTGELAENTSEALKDRKGVVVSGHGTFAIGKTLEEAYVVTTLLEHSSRLRYYFDVAKNINQPSTSPPSPLCSPSASPASKPARMHRRARTRFRFSTFPEIRNPLILQVPSLQA